MKRKLPLIVVFIIALCLALFIGGPADAKSKPTPAPSGSPLVANVSLYIVKDYNSTTYSVYASHYVGMEDTPYGTYPRYEPCTPDVCGTLVIGHKGKTPTVTLSKLASETVVSGTKGYASADYSVSFNLTWDGSSIPLTRKFRDSGKPVSTQLQYAFIALNKADDPAPRSPPRRAASDMSSWEVTTSWQVPPTARHSDTCTTLLNYYTLKDRPFQGLFCCHKKAHQKVSFIRGDLTGNRPTFRQARNYIFQNKF